ncbi:hypothetical protein OBV_03600 [Oscillibacter valericigenes Sjm18-20]|nr:hypothetical protein OBV_03600 [Oscillibacter valericigenes Sjm18-20]
MEYLLKSDASILRDKEKTCRNCSRFDRRKIQGLDTTAPAVSCYVYDVHVENSLNLMINRNLIVY